MGPARIASRNPHALKRPCHQEFLTQECQPLRLAAFLSCCKVGSGEAARQHPCLLSVPKWATHTRGYVKPPHPFA